LRRRSERSLVLQIVLVAVVSHLLSSGEKLTIPHIWSTAFEPCPRVRVPGKGCRSSLPLQRRCRRDRCRRAKTQVPQRQPVAGGTIWVPLPATAILLKPEGLLLTITRGVNEPLSVVRDSSRDNMPELVRRVSFADAKEIVRIFRARVLLVSETGCHKNCRDRDHNPPAYVRGFKLTDSTEKYLRHAVSRRRSTYVVHGHIRQGVSGFPSDSVTASVEHETWRTLDTRDFLSESVYDSEGDVDWMIGVVRVRIESISPDTLLFTGRPRSPLSRLTWCARARQIEHRKTDVS
jgi:hypothetical protein